MIIGEYFEAGISRGRPATMEARDDYLVLATEGLTKSFDPNELGISQRLAGVPRRVHFADGSMFSTSDNEQMDELLRDVGRSPPSSWISFFEAGWRWTLLALLVIPTILYLLFTVGMPIVSGPMAAMVPESIKDNLDTEVVDFLDKNLFESTKLELGQQAILTDMLDQVSLWKDTQLLFRGGGALGANALALPGGIIILTDEIVELAEYEGELMAVLAHEVGHVNGNHSMRNIIQSAGVTFVLGWMLGDLSLVTDIVLVGIPVLLEEMAYSRKFELEADASALWLLEVMGYSSSCFAALMEKLAAQNETNFGEFPDYLSSHPPTRERIERARSDQPCSEREPGFDGWDKDTWDEDSQEAIKDEPGIECTSP